MNLNSFIAMRQEIILLVIILSLIVCEIFVNKKNKAGVINLAVYLFGIHTIVGFFPTDETELFGGMFRASNYIHFFKNALNVGVFIILLQSVDWIKANLLPANKGTEFFMILFSSLLGMYFMISSGDFLMFYIGLELSTIPIAALVAFETSKRISSEAGIKFILSAGLASGISLFGVSLMYAQTGSIYFTEISVVLQSLQSSNLILLGFILFFSGLAFKISLVPFHFWTADVYEGAPIGIASYLSVISKGSAVFILMFLLFTVFKPLMHVWENIVYVIAVATMFIGNFFAIRQQNMKRFLAFSSVAQAGFILLGLIAGTQLGAATAVYFVLVYVFSNLAAFGVVQAISNQHEGKENMSDYDGLYRTNPKLSLVITLALFSLAGIPPMAGFFGKFFLFTAAASKGYYLLVFLAAVNATISLYYYLLVVRSVFIRKSDNPIPYFRNKPFMRLGLILTVIGIMVLGLYSPIYDYIYNLSSIFN